MSNVNLMEVNQFDGIRKKCEALRRERRKLHILREAYNIQVEFGFREGYDALLNTEAALLSRLGKMTDEIIAQVATDCVNGYLTTQDVYHIIKRML